jgi:hypothetical protein
MQQERTDALPGLQRAASHQEWPETWVVFATFERGDSAHRQPGTSPHHRGA